MEEQPPVPDLMPDYRSRTPILVGFASVVLILGLNLGVGFALRDWIGGVGSTPPDARLLIAASQVLLMLLPSLLIARLVARDLPRFLRLRPVSFLTCGVAVVGTLATLMVAQLYLLVQEIYLVPDGWMSTYLAERQGMMEQYRLFIGWESMPELALALLIAAVLPALCEEIWFRGLVQGSFERAMAPGLAFVLAGILFGFIHLQISNLVVISMLGAFLGYLTWSTGSIIPAMLGHFTINAFMVFFFQSIDTGATYSAHTPAYLLRYSPAALLGMGILFFVIAWLRRRREKEMRMMAGEDAI